MGIEETVTIPKKEYEALLALIPLVAELKLTIHKLEEEILLLKNGKKSNTSHTPPSHDIGRSNQKNSREKSGKNPGGQQGHKGSTLQMKEIADEVIKHEPLFCSHCSEDLANSISALDERRQEVVIPPVWMKYIEHQSYVKTCGHCQHQTKGQFPESVTAPIQYGENVSALIAYLSVYQYLPYNRIKKLINDLFQLPISEGTIDNIIKKMTGRALPMYQEIQRRIEAGDLVGADETGTKINTAKGWFHVWQNSRLTFIVPSLNRGYATVEENFQDGFQDAVYVSDCWSSQLKVPALKHQLCFAHLLRELKNFEDTFSCEWSLKVKKLFQRAIKLKNEMAQQDFLDPPIAVGEIESELDELLEVNAEKFHKKQKAFIKRLMKNRQSIFVFLYHQQAPYDNNGSERAIRNVKVKNKISGCFRSFHGAFSFAVLRSVIDTAIKNTGDVFEAIHLVAKFRPEQ